MQELLNVNLVDEKTTRAFFHALEKFGQRPDVTGVDIGMKVKGGAHREEAGAVIRIHVREKKGRRAVSQGEMLPRTFMGVPVDVIEAWYVDHQNGAGCHPDPGRMQQQRPVIAGVSVGHGSEGTGTLGLIVREIGTGRAALLSSDHVIAPDGATAGDAITQPASADGGLPGDVIGTVGRWNRLTASAIAFLDPALPTDGRQFESLVTVGPPRIPIIGEILEKSGRTTGLTQAMVDGLGSFDGVFPAMRLVPVATGIADCPLSDFGDSGSVWYDPITGEGVGLHVKGNASPNPEVQFGIASALFYVTSKLQVEV